MSTELLSMFILIPTAAVVVALFAIMWRERSTAADGRVALVSTVGLAGWATLSAVFALRGTYLPPDQGLPPIGIALVIVLVTLAVVLGTSPTLRRLLTNQKNLIRLNVWRLVGAVFLVLMVAGQVPALWAIPTGLGDIIVGALAFWVASQLDTAGGARRAIIFNLWGLADLVVAISLGVMTSPGATQVFHTVPTAELVTRFPLALVPTFLVPLAIANHVVSLRQLVAGTWATNRELTRANRRRNEAVP